MILSPSRYIIMVASLLLVIRAESQLGAPQSIMIANQEQQTLLPALVDPRKANCAIQYVNGKKIVPANNNPAECQKEMIEQAKIRKAQAIETAAKAIQMVDQAKTIAPKCVKSVDLRETSCIKTKLLNDIKNKPTYTVTGQENKVYVYKEGKKIMMAFNIQNHFVKEDKPPSDQAKIIDKAKEAYVFNAIGEVLSTKQTKKKKTPQCICPGQTTPQTAEGTPLINECRKHECRNYDLFVNILSNTTVSDAGQTDKSDKKEDSKDKKDGDKDTKPSSGSNA